MAFKFNMCSEAKHGKKEIKLHYLTITSCWPAESQLQSVSTIGSASSLKTWNRKFSFHDADSERAFGFTTTLDFLCFPKERITKRLTGRSAGWGRFSAQTSEICRIPRFCPLFSCLTGGPFGDLPSRHWEDVFFTGTSLEILAFSVAYRSFRNSSSLCPERKKSMNSSLLISFDPSSSMLAKTSSALSFLKSMAWRKGACQNAKQQPAYASTYLHTRTRTCIPAYTSHIPLHEARLRLLTSPYNCINSALHKARHRQSPLLQQVYLQCRDELILADHPEPARVKRVEETRRQLLPVHLMRCPMT